MKLMVCIDGSKPAEKAIEIASQLANVSGSELTILHVIENEISRKEPVYDEYGEAYRKAKAIIKDGEKVVARTAPGLTAKTRIAVGPVSAEIVRIARGEISGAVYWQYRQKQT